MAKKQFHAARVGREGPKVYDSWTECERQTSGYPGETHRAFDTLGEAWRWIHDGNKAKEKKPEARGRALYPDDDGICTWTQGNGTNNGITIKSAILSGGKVLIEAVIPAERIDCAEFVGLVQTLKRCKESGTKGKVYCRNEATLDSVKNYRTGPFNEVDFSKNEKELVREAVDWLWANSNYNKCEKWDNAWGDMASWVN